MCFCNIIRDIFLYFVWIFSKISPVYLLYDNSGLIFILYIALIHVVFHLLKMIRISVQILLSHIILLHIPMLLFWLILRWISSCESEVIPFIQRNICNAQSISFWSSKQENECCKFSCLTSSCKYGKYTYLVFNVWYKSFEFTTSSSPLRNAR